MGGLMRVLFWMVVSVWPGFAAAQTASSGNVAKGAQVFRACAGCHALDAGRNLSGPSLAGLMGRKAGSVPGFLRYSAALKASGITWTPQTLDAWVANPEALVPGNAMPFRGIPDPATRADLVAFLEGVLKGDRDAMAELARIPQLPPLKTTDAAHRVAAVRHCKDSYFVSTADGGTRSFWEFDLRFKTDSSDRGPNKKQPVLVGQGMGGDRAQIVFANPGEISVFIKDHCE